MLCDGEFIVEFGCAAERRFGHLVFSGELEVPACAPEDDRRIGLDDRRFLQQERGVVEVARPLAVARRDE